MVTKESHIIPFNFGALPPSLSEWDDAEVVILPVPYDLTASYQSGARRGPMAILEASSQLEWYDEELGEETCRAGIHTLPFMEPAADGAERMAHRVKNCVLDILEAGKFPVLLGGEHSLTLGMVEAMRKRYSDLSVLFLDAHCDMRDIYQESKYSHACVGRRIAERCSIVQVGIRSFSLEEAEHLKDAGVPVVMAQSFTTKRDHVGSILSRLRETVYVSVDLDVLDPSIMPSVGTPEPGGLGWHEILELLRHVCVGHQIVGFDVMELCPIPGIIAPDFLAAKLVYKFIGYSLKKGGTREN